MRLVVIDKKDPQLKTANQTLVVDGQKIPFGLIDTLIIVGKSTLSTSDLTRLTAAETQILLLSHNLTHAALVTSTSGKSAELKLTQYRAALEKALTIAKEILRRKINSHAAHLAKHEITLFTAEIVEAIDDADSLETLLGIEGSFSKRYFEHYFALFPKRFHKGKRTKRPPRDPLNALLSLYYTLIYNLITIRLIGFGFEPGIGFLHRPFRGHHALASDLLELFRSDINAFVHAIVTDNLVTLEDFSRQKGGVYLRYQGRKKLWKPFHDFTLTLQPKIDTAIADIRSLL